MKRNIFQKLFVFMMAMMLVLPVFSGLEVQAAAKPSLSETKKVIAIGSYGVLGETSPIFHKKNTKYSINVENSKKGATYTFTSSNKKIATVKAIKTTGYITGVKEGTATITVKQKFKGKTTTVGSCKVTVKGASVRASEIASDRVAVGEGVWYNSDNSEGICIIENQNPEAEYTFESNSDNFKMLPLKTDLESYGDGYFVFGQGYIAKKAGTYTVTVKETYKKKTKTLGKIKVVVHENCLRYNKIRLSVGETQNIQNLLEYYAGGWLMDCAEEDILELGDNDWDGSPTVKAVKAGSAELKFYYEGDEKGTFGDLIGICKVTVEEVKVTDIRLEDETINVCEYDEGSDPLYNKYELITEPSDLWYYGDVTFTSSDEKVVSISSEGNCQVEGVGTATVTITAGDVSKTVTVNVLTADEYYNLDDEEEYW